MRICARIYEKARKYTAYWLYMLIGAKPPHHSKPPRVCFYFAPSYTLKSPCPYLF